MKRTYGAIALVMLLALNLLACGLEQVVPSASVQSIESKSKEDANKVSPPGKAPKAVHPLKDGYQPIFGRSTRVDPWLRLAWQAHLSSSVLVSIVACAWGR
jgi:hypothetical protein